MSIKKVTVLLLLGLSSLWAKNDLMRGLTDIVDRVEEKKAEDKKVLNYAFKQRMRTQWMSRDALLIFMDFNSSFYQKEIVVNADLFNKNFNNLINSKKDIKKAEKRDPNFAKKVEEVKEIWLTFYDSVKKISKDSKDKDALKLIVENNMKLLNGIAYIFTNFMESYQSTDKLEASMAHIKSMLYTQVGKPRMYINKLVKERLLIEQNINAKDNQNSFNQSVKDMDRLMKALKDGDKELELHGTEDRKILEKLSISQKIWEDVKAIAKKNSLNKKELSRLIEKNEEFIKAQTEVVKLTRELNNN